MATEGTWTEEGSEGAEAVTEARPEGPDAGAPSAEPGSIDGPVGDELAQAGAEAGDPAAAGVNAEGGDAYARGEDDTASLGSSAGSSEGDQTLLERVEALADERPEVVVGAAFAGGLILARLLSALGGDT